MANIDKELQAINDAIYGEEVRSAIHDGIKAVNDSATDSALVAETKAEIAIEKANEAHSYAVGGTGTREGEDTDNAKYYYELARGFAPVGYDQLVVDVAEMKINKQNKLVAGTNITIDPETNTISAEGGGAGSWSELTGKPFNTLNEDQFYSANGKLTSKLQAKDILTDDNMNIQKKLDVLESFESITYKGTVASVANLPANAENGWMYYVQADRKHYVCVKDDLIGLYEWHEYHTFDDGYIITVEKVKNNLVTSDEGFVLDARQGKELKTSIDNVLNNVASAWSASKAYAVGEYFFYNGKYYKVKKACSAIEPPNLTYYEETTVSREQGGIRFGIDGDGIYGYYKADDSFVPFKSGASDPRKFVIKDGEFIGELNVDYKIDTSYSKENDYLVISGSPYTSGLGIYGDVSKYKRIVFEAIPQSTTGGVESRIYYGDYHTEHWRDSSGLTTVEIELHPSSEFFWYMPRVNARIYNVYLE